VRRQRDLEAATHHGAMHRRDYRYFESFERVEQHAIFHFARRTAELADVRTGKESRAFAHQDYGA